MATYGWCEAPDHPRHDHMRQDTCEAFISDCCHTGKLMADAKAHDDRARYATTPEAAYVAEHRPY